MGQFLGDGTTSNITMISNSKSALGAIEKQMEWPGKNMNVNDAECDILMAIKP